MTVRDRTTNRNLGKYIQGQSLREKNHRRNVQTYVDTSRDTASCEGEHFKRREVRAAKHLEKLIVLHMSNNPCVCPVRRLQNPVPTEAP